METEKRIGRKPMENPRSEILRTTVTVEEAMTIKALAEVEGRTVSGMIRDILRDVCGIKEQR